MIKQILDSLKDNERRRLMYAFENEFAQHVELDGGKFIGVHMSPLKNLEILESAGVWSYGRRRNG